MSRNYRFDNIKFVLITLVIFGHFLELIDGQTANSLYRVIYLFHIPAFIFITGYFARFNPSKILFSFILPYVILQTMYLVFDALVITDNSFVKLQFTKPYWLLWYLMAIIFYYLLIPFFDTKNKSKQCLLVTASIVLSLLAGLDENIGYFLSLSRFFTFMPYFLIGYYLSENHSLEDVARKKKSSFVLLFAAICGVFISIVFILNSSIHDYVLYGSLSYEALNYGLGTKLILLVFGFCWITLFLYLIPNTKLPLISLIGKNTFPIYVLHGFIVKWIDKYNLFSYDELPNILLALILTGGILILLGNKYTARLFKLLFDWNKKKNNA